MHLKVSESLTVYVIANTIYHIHRLKTARFTDKRVSIMNEIVAGIRIIKMYCWEHSFRDLIADIRRYVHQSYIMRV